MKKTNKFLLALSAFSLCVVGVVGGVSALNVSAQTGITSVENVSLAMVDGAAVRYSKPANDTQEAKEEAYKKNGIKFTVGLSKTDYEGLEALEQAGTYSDVSYGVLIAPESYGTLDAATVFGVDGEKQYDWAVWNAENGKWEYNGNGEYTRITNIVSQTMSWNEKTTQYQWSASLTNLKKANLDRKFQGVGYIAYTAKVDGVDVTKYLFTNDNSVRSMVQVAQLAVEDPENAGIVENLTEAYITPVTDVEKTYTVEHYLLSNDNDSEKLLENEGLITSVTATIDDPINYTELVSNGEETTNYIFADYSNKNQIGTKVYADGDNTVKLYYKDVEVDSKIITSDASYAGSDSYLVSNDTAFGMVWRLGYHKANTNTANWRLDYRLTSPNAADSSKKFIGRFGLEYASTTNTIKIYSSVAVASGVKTKSFTEEESQEIKNRIATNSYYFVIGRSAASESDTKYSLYTVYADLNLDGVVEEQEEQVFTLNFETNTNYEASMRFGPGCANMGAQGETVFGEFTTFVGSNGINRALESVAMEKYTVTSGKRDTRTYFENYTLSDNNVLVADVEFTQATAAANAEGSWCLDLRAYNNTSGASGFCALASIIYTYDATTATGTLSIDRRQFNNGSYTFEDTSAALEALANGELQLVIVREANSFEYFVEVDGALIFVGSYTTSAFATGYDFLRLGFNTWGTIGTPKDTNGMQVTYTVYDGIN